MSCLDITPPRYVGLRRTPNKRSWILKIETSAIHLKMNAFQHALRKTSTATQTTDRIPLNAHFSSKLRGDSQVCSLEANCFWHGYSSTPDAIPNWLKCAGNFKWMRLQALRRGSVNWRRDGASAKLLWLGTRPNLESIPNWNSSFTKVSVNNFDTRVAPTPCMYADRAASLSM